MAAVSTVRIYDTLKSHFGEADARQFIEYLETLTRKARGELTTKADVTKLRADLEKQITEVKADLEKQLPVSESNLRLTSPRLNLIFSTGCSSAGLGKWLRFLV